MNSQDAKQLVMQGYKLFKNKDIKGLLALCTDNVEWTGPESDYIPFSGSYQGKEQVAQFFTLLDECQEMLQFEPQAFIAEGEQVAVTGREQGLVKATGEKYESSWVHVFTIQRGRIARFQHYEDTAAAETAFRPAPTAKRQTKPSMHH